MRLSDAIHGFRLTEARKVKAKGPAIFFAQMPFAGYTCKATGKSEQAAKLALLRGWRDLVKSDSYYHDPSGAIDAKNDKVALLELENYFGISVSKLPLGGFAFE